MSEDNLWTFAEKILDAIYIVTGKQFKIFFFKHWTKK